MERVSIERGSLARAGRAGASAVGWWRGARRAAPALGYLAPPLIALVALGVAWEIWTRVQGTPVYILPAPSVVLRRLFDDPGFFARHGATTLWESLAGFGLGSAVALAGAVVMAHSRFLEKSLFPLAVLVKVTPIVAVAPLFVIWWGFGPLPRVAIAALLSFFPVLVNGVYGFRAVNPGALDFLRSVRASPWEVFRLLRAPSALPYLFAAFRIVIPLAVIGAVVAEWSSGARGLGAVVLVAANNVDMPTLFAAVFTLAIIGIALTIVASAFERQVLFWHESTLAR